MLMPSLYSFHPFLKQTEKKKLQQQLEMLSLREIYKDHVTNKDCQHAT